VECRLPSNYERDGTDWQPVTDRIVNSRNTDKNDHYDSTKI
jgi:hypothetical protein